MSRQLSLFAPVGAAAQPKEVLKLSAGLADGLYLGTSSWSFPGWQGLVYDRKTSQTVLARHGLNAYARHPLFRSVSIDRTFYGPMRADELRDYRDAVPEDFRFVVKAHELLTRARTKDEPRSENPLFLDAAYANEEVIGPCIEGLGPKAGMLVFQFPPQRFDSVPAFVEQLGRFLQALPPKLDYAVELRNPEVLVPDYVSVLADTGATHCLNVHPTMPPVAEQRRSVADGSATVLLRWMLRRNQTYGDAKEAFYPFDKIAERDDASRDAIADVCRGAKRAFVIVNNKAEGSAPLSLQRLAEALYSPPSVSA